MTDQPPTDEPQDQAAGVDLAPHQHELPDGRRVALGRPTVKSDPRTLRLARYLVRPNLPSPADRVNNSHALGTTPIGMYKNDVWGNCTAAGVMHTIMVDTALVGAMVTPSQATCDSLYVAVTGAEGAAFDPNTGANDNGCNELDVLNYWRHNPIEGVQLIAFAAIDPKDLDLMRIAQGMFGTLYYGVNLPLTAQDQVGRLWDYVDKPGNEPGSWGGHCIVQPDIDWTGTQKVGGNETWGALQLMTDQFMLRYCDELYVPLTSAWAVRAPSDQFNFQLLQQDLAAFGPVNPQ